MAAADRATIEAGTPGIELMERAGAACTRAAVRLAGGVGGCRFLVVAFTTDWRFAPSRSQELVNALIAERKDVSYADIDAPQGHDSFLVPIPRYITLLKNFLNRIPEANHAS